VVPNLEYRVEIQSLRSICRITEICESPYQHRPLQYKNSWVQFHKGHVLSCVAEPCHFLGCLSFPATSARHSRQALSMP
jgi:hypothetical protein